MKFEDYIKYIIKDSSLSEKKEYLDNKKDYSDYSEDYINIKIEYYKKQLEYLSQNINIKTKEEQIREDRKKKIKKIFDNEWYIFFKFIC